MAMPWKIEHYPGPGGLPRPYKIYPDGFSELASAEESQLWGHVQELERRIELLQVKRDEPADRPAHQEKAAPQSVAAAASGGKRR